MRAAPNAASREQAGPPMPELVRFLVRHALIGIAVAAASVAALLTFDVARLGTLVWQSPSGIVAVIALTCGLAITFGSVQMGFAVMLLRTSEDDARGGKPRHTDAPEGARPALATLPGRRATGRDRRLFEAF